MTTLKHNDLQTRFDLLAATGLLRAQGLSPPGLEISGSPISDGQVGVAYAGFTVTASGGVPPYSYAVVSGQLAPGITLDTSTGVVSGTPTETYFAPAIVIGVTDAASQAALLPAFGMEITAPDAYTCGAVAFDGATLLDNATFTMADSPLGLVSIWNYSPTGAVESFYGTTQSSAYWSITIYPGGGVDVSVWDGATNSKSFEFKCGDLTADTWSNVLIAVDTNHPAGEKIGRIVVNGAAQSVTVVADADPAFDIGWGVAGQTVEFGQSTNTGWGADWWFGFGQFLNISDPANVAKFISGGKPVDLGSDGSTPTGTAPAIFLHIPSAGTPSDFAMNLGTGGDFTVTGALTLAPSSPSD